MKKSWLEHVNIFPGVLKISKHMGQNYVQNTKSSFELLEIQEKLPIGGIHVCFVFLYLKFYT